MPVTRLRIGRTFLQELVEHLQRIGILPGGIINQSAFPPNFLMTVRGILFNDFFKMLNRVGQAVLPAGNAPKLIMRIRFVRVNFNCPRQRAYRRIQIAPLLVDQPQILMRGRICRI